MSATSHFHQNLPILRRRAGFTQESLAEALGVSRQAVSKWESGAALPEAATLLALAELLDCSLDELMLHEEVSTGPEKRPVPVSPPPVTPSDELLLAYDQHMNRFALLIAAGVLMILVGLGQMMALFGIFENAVGVGIFLLCVAASVFLFVWGGITHDSFLKSFPGLPDDARPQPAEGFTRMFQFGLPLAVALIVGAVALFVVFVSFFHSKRFVMLALGLFFFLLGLAVGAIVYLGILKSRYSEDGWKAVSQSAKEHPQAVHPLSGAVMTGATVVYLGLGFLFHLWHPGWLVFPLAAAVCAALNAKAK